MLYFEWRDLHRLARERFQHPGLAIRRALWDAIVIPMAIFTAVLQLWLIAFLVKHPSNTVFIVEIVMVRPRFRPASFLSTHNGLKDYIVSLYPSLMTY